jgi:hypothetical protein
LGVCVNVGGGEMKECKALVHMCEVKSLILIVGVGVVMGVGWVYVNVGGKK